MVAITQRAVKRCRFSCCVAVSDGFRCSWRSCQLVRIIFNRIFQSKRVLNKGREEKKIWNVSVVFARVHNGAENGP